MSSGIRHRIIFLARGLLPDFGRLFRNRGGATAIEFAVVGPILALLLICSVDLGLGIYRKMQVQNAAQIGTQYAAINGFDQTAIAGAIASATSYSEIVASPPPTKFCGCPSNAGVTAADCGAVCESGQAPGTYVIASTRATYKPILQYPMLPDSFTLIGRSTVRIQ
ncbi:MAG TPA: TadE/TadG family type IV pilus assembly protein [Pseudolabrys sp.]|nr:TadE/TadG family type IV pilus assembly protein [Pseudolabrys sp.]